MKLIAAFAAGIAVAAALPGGGWGTKTWGSECESTIVDSGQHDVIATDLAPTASTVYATKTEWCVGFGKSDSQQS